MASGFIRGLAKLLMWDGVNFVPNVNQLVGRIVELGFGYKKQEMWHDARNIFEIVSKRGQGPEDWHFELFPRANMPELFWKSDRLYNVHGWATYEDSLTGERTRRRVSLYTDTYIEGYGYLDELRKLDDEQGRYTGSYAVEFEPSTMWHKRGAPYSSAESLEEI